jgi:hypothetical protein
MKKPSISTFSFVIVIIALLIFGQVGTQVHAQSPRLAPGLVATQPPSASSPGPQELMDAPSWVDGIPWYSYVADFMGNYPVQGVGTFVGYWQNADEGLPAVNLVYYIHGVAMGLIALNGHQSALYDVSVTPNTILAISSTNLCIVMEAFLWNHSRVISPCNSWLRDSMLSFR